MIQNSVLAKAIVLYHLCGVVQIKPKDECLKKTSQFLKSLMNTGCTPFKGYKIIAIIAISVRANVYIETQDDILFLSIEN